MKELLKCDSESDLPALILKHKLDRRRKYSLYCGYVVYTEWVTVPCSGCDGDKCFECGYQGKVRTPFPQPILI